MSKQETVCKNAENCFLAKHGTKSWDIVKRILLTFFKPPIRILDLTYGTGRFYKSLDRSILTITAVDVEKHKWEVEPNVFYQMRAQEFVNKVIGKSIELGEIDVVVVDPPWDALKRGKIKYNIRLAARPYRFSENPESIINAALLIVKSLGKPLMYKYMRVIECKHKALWISEIKIFGNKGYNYYGLCVDWKE